MELAFFDITILAADRLAIAILFAASLAGIWLNTHNNERNHVLNTLKYSIDISIVLLVLSTCLVLLLRTAALADVPLNETLPYVKKVIEKSQYGTTWLGRVVALATIIVIWLFIRQRQLPVGYAIMLCALITTAFFISGASHAGEDGLWAFENINNSLHILAGSLWGGSVLIYALFIRQLVRQNSHVTTIANQLSLIATIALATVIATGLLNAWFRLDALSDLWTSDYGLVLIIKLVLVFIMMNIGALNRFVLIPWLISHEAGHKQALLNLLPNLVFKRALYLDSMIFCLIIVVATALATISPGH